MGNIIELIERYARGIALYFGWFFRSPRAEAEPLNLAVDARLIVYAALTLIGGLLLYYKLFDRPPEELVGAAGRAEFKAAFGETVTYRAVLRLAIWAGIAAVAHVLCSVRNAKLDAIDTLSAVLRVAPIVSVLATLIGALALHLHYALRPHWALSQMLGLVVIPLAGAALLVWSLPRSLQVAPTVGPRRALAASVICALGTCLVGLYAVFGNSTL